MLWAFKIWVVIMNKDVWGDTIGEDKSKAVLADSEDKFYKMLYVFSQKLAYTAMEKAVETVNGVQENGDVDPEEVLKSIASIASESISVFKIIFNDYHCLVRDGKIPAINLPHTKESGIDELREQFEEEVKDATMELAMAGVPVKEKEDGSIETDYKEFLKKQEKGEL